MSNTYNWSIEALDCAPSTEGQTNVVKTVHWRCTASDNATPTPHTASIYSTCSVNYTEGSPFTAFNSLTKAEVLSWVWGNGVDQTATQTALDAMIQAQITPAIITPALPFTN